MLSSCFISTINSPSLRTDARPLDKLDTTVLYVYILVPSLSCHMTQSKLIDVFAPLIPQTDNRIAVWKLYLHAYVCNNFI